MILFQEGILKRVLIISSNDLLSVGVVSLLSNEADFEVINANIADKPDLASAIDEIRPLVLIVNESLLVANFYAFLGWLRDTSVLRVIVLDERENLLHVYEKQVVDHRRASDLIAIIRQHQYINC